MRFRTRHFRNSIIMVVASLVTVFPQGVYPAGQAPLNQFNIGDSIGIGEAAAGSGLGGIGVPDRGSVWSTGYDNADVVLSLNERFEQSCPAEYTENDSATDSTYNHAVSGADMADFVTQANAVISAAGTTTEGEAGMVSVLLGANDMCNASLATLQSTEFSGLFESRFRAGLDALKASAVTSNASIHVSGIPAIYWLWNAGREDNYCRFIWNFGVGVCQVLLANPDVEDCASNDSRLDPNTNYPGDGTNCMRRKQFHAVIRDTYNPILESVVEEYANSGDLPNAYFVDIFGIQFSSDHVSDADCFHPSREGQALLAESGWSQSPWPMSPGKRIVPVVIPFLLD